MNKFKIDISFILIIIMIILSPKQTILIKILLVLFVHETGHLIFKYLFRLEVTELRLYATGIIMKIDENLLDWWQNILLYSGGILFNIILFIVNKGNELGEISLFLAIVNLLPIYPLDGFQIIKVIIEYFIPVYYSQYIMIFISSFFTVISFGISIALGFDKYILLNLVYLLFIGYSLIKNRRINYYNFLLHRYLHSFNIRTKKLKYKGDVEKCIYRYHYTIFMLEDKVYDEKTILNYYFVIN